MGGALRRPVALGVAWLTLMALVAPATPVAEEPVGDAQPPVELPTDSPEVAAEPEVAEPTEDPPPLPAAEAPPVAQPPSPTPRSVAAEPVERRQPELATPTATAAASGSVTIDDFSFSPSSITVGVGDTVTWANSGPSAHTATATDGSFDTGLLDSGESASATFERAGSFSYLCEPHPFMKGTVRVVAQSSGETGETESDSGAAPNGDATSAGSGDTGSETSTLPATGTEPAWLLLTGAGLVLIGAVGRRRTVA